MSVKLFEAIRVIDNRCMMSTNCESCVPYQYLKSMKESGYRFKVAGKFVGIQDVAKAVKSALESGVGKRAESHSEIEGDNKSSQSVSQHTNTFPACSREVRCIETGKIYPSQSAASKDLGIDPAQVSDSIKTGRRRSGYTFERVQR